MKDNTKVPMRLADMLTYRRVSRQQGEEEFIAKYIDVVPGMNVDGYGNRWVMVGQSETLFSCHTDTVHFDRNTEHVPRQNIQTDAAMSRFFKEKGTGCLGADDGVGVFIMLEMIAAKVPGLYIFHREEETGGKGSSYIARSPEWSLLLSQMKRAVAFDRRGTNSVITYQGCERSCSDEFANALCIALGMGHVPDDGGLFTDTANYYEHIPECTNISAGYENEHSDAEYLDVPYVMRLAEACLTVDWEALPTVQDKGNRDSLYGSWSDFSWPTKKKKTVSLDTVYAVKEMDIDTLRDFLMYCGVDDADVDEYYYELSMGELDGTPFDSLTL